MLYCITFTAILNAEVCVPMLVSDGKQNDPWV